MTFENFDIQNSTVTVWVFKKGHVTGATPRYTGRWIDTNLDLDLALKAAAMSERSRITEKYDYDLLRDTNDNSALTMAAIETHSGLILDQADSKTVDKKVSKLKDIQNTDFYVLKFVHDDHVLIAVKKTDSSWQSKKMSGAIPAVFSDEQLGLNNDPTFNVSQHIDFFIYDDELVICNKKNFESVLNYKQAHAEDFFELQNEPEFSSIFTAIDPLVAYIGNNKINLRRMCAIRQKGHYKDPDFMRRLQANFSRCGLDLQFDAAGRLVLTPNNCADVVKALLDHRLVSFFSENNYDVPDAIKV